MAKQSEVMAVVSRQSGCGTAVTFRKVSDLGNFETQHCWGHISHRLMTMVRLEKSCNRKR
jgi:hypothetical protein